ncbi:prohead protease/major capsid protein fusion protein [Asticcacaulis tiandongensis]|uniref:prohead protease/major capsid protein fusion protein n=1 Tax=Asticcacaulis tiandongensis TaxID=2565365 RepID=UPI00112C1699|nr:prohead protease/major capsid protein fusion protein [Asticcacaulis tiandongensis]
MPDNPQPIETRSAPATFSPDTLNLETGTVEAVISTGAPVLRKGYTERLALGRENVTLAPRLPVLDAHRQASISDIKGQVVDVRFEAGRIIATLKISDPVVLAAIERGDVTGVSIGYSVSQWSDTADAQGRNRVRTATAWTLKEVSLVPVPADPSALLRSTHMTEITEQPAENLNADTIETRAAIRQIARTAGLDSQWADAQIDADATVIEARAAAFEAIQTRSRQTPAIRVVSAGDDPAAQRRAREDALYARASGTAPSDQGRAYMGDTLRDHARAILETNGVSTRGLSADEIFYRAMHTTSDFKNLLVNTGNRTLLPAYEIAQSPLKKLARQSTLTDFRAASRLKLSDIGLLQKVTESGEIKSTSRGEAAESYKLDTYATIFSLSRQALINDDLGAFRDWGNTAGRMAAETETNVLVNLLLSNPLMGEDNKALFHADHGNLAIGDLDIDAIRAARLALRTRKGLDGVTPINATPRFLLISPDQETKADDIMAILHDATVDFAPELLRNLSVLVDPRLPNGSWYVFADPAALPVLEYAYLSSAQGPQMSSREGWDTLGMEFRVVLDFGAGAIDHRGAYKGG